MQNETFRPHRKTWFTILRRANTWLHDLSDPEEFVDHVWKLREDLERNRNLVRRMHTEERFK